MQEIKKALAGAAKAELGFAGKSVVLTFGLLGPSKGIDLMIEAMPLAQSMYSLPSASTIRQPFPSSIATIR